MSFLDYINPFNKILDIVDKAVPDRDLREKIKVELAGIEKDLRIAGLNAQTIPWVDALYKMAPVLGAACHFFACVVLIYFRPEIDPVTLAALGAGGAAHSMSDAFKRR
jgi:hypothetical protein